MFNILEGYPLKELGFGSAQAVHDEIETMRHAYVDRNNLLGDPDFVKNPVDQLTSKDYAAKIRAAIDPAHATRSADLAPGRPPHEGVETTHYSIVDKDGDAVAVTYSLNDAFGAKVVAGDTGVLLNDTMDDFTAKVGAANIYGLVQGEKNAIRARQDAAELDVADHRDQGRQAGAGARHARRQSDHHRRHGDDPRRDRLRHVDRRRRSTRRASTTSGCPT